MIVVVGKNHHHRYLAAWRYVCCEILAVESKLGHSLLKSMQEKATCISYVLKVFAAIHAGFSVIKMAGHFLTPRCSELCLTKRRVSKA